MKRVAKSEVSARDICTLKTISVRRWRGRRGQATRIFCGLLVRFEIVS